MPVTLKLYLQLMKKVFTYINAYQFHKNYCPQIKRFKQKQWGFDSNKKPLDFTEADKALIRAGLTRLHQDLMKHF